MTYGIVQTQEVIQNGGTTSTVIPCTATTAGNLVFATIGGIPPTSVTDNLGSTYTLIGSLGSFLYLYYLKNCPAGITSITLNHNQGAPSSAIMREYSGLATGFVQDQYAADQGDIATPTTFSSGNTGLLSTSNEIVVGVASFQSSPTASLTAGTGFGNFNQIANNTFSQIFAIEDKLASSGAAQAATFASNESGGPYYCAVATFILGASAATSKSSLSACGAGS